MPARPQGWQDALIVRCPTCYRMPKRKCISLQTGNPKRWAHPARVRAYQSTITNAKDRHDHDRQPAGQRL